MYPLLPQKVHKGWEEKGGEGLTKPIAAIDGEDLAMSSILLHVLLR